MSMRIFRSPGTRARSSSIQAVASGLLACLLALGTLGVVAATAEPVSAAPVKTIQLAKEPGGKPPGWPPDERFATWNLKSGIVPHAAQFRLIDFARAFERHDWNKALTFFDPLHLGEQAKLFAEDTFKKKPSQLSPAERRTLAHWYLYDTLEIRPATGPSASTLRDRSRFLARVAKLRYVGLRKSDGETWNVRFTVYDKRGVLIGRGVIQVQRKDLKFTGAVG